jgi:hypothetical protein
MQGHIGDACFYCELAVPEYSIKGHQNNAQRLTVGGSIKKLTNSASKADPFTGI